MNVESIQKVFATVQNEILSLRDDEVEGLPDFFDWNELQQSRLLSHHGSSMPSNWQCTEFMAWSWNSRSVCRQCGRHWNSSNGKPTKAVKKESRQEAAPLSAEEQVMDAPRERLVATLKLKGKSASLAIPQSTRAAVERRADQIRQRLREMDPMSLRMAVAQRNSFGKGTAAAEQAERDRKQAQLRRDQLVEDMRLLSEKMADQSGGVLARIRRMGGVSGIATRPLGTVGITGSPKSRPRRRELLKSSTCRRW